MDADATQSFAGITALSSLDDPVRRRLYAYVAAQDTPASREDAAAAAGIGRTLAAYHLDKLAEAGLLVVSYARPPGRGGPGAGRPAKLYARIERELVVSVPPRNYKLLAQLLADAVGDDGSGVLRAALESAAYNTGHATGRSAPDVWTALRNCGYQPVQTGEVGGDRGSDPGGDVELRNCPFDQLARQHTELVCWLNQQLLQGVLDGSRAPHARACLRPQPGRCCVRIENLERARTRRWRRKARGRADITTATEGDDTR